MNQNDLRMKYEKAIGKRVTDVTWYKTRQLLEKNGLQCNADNLNFLAQLKKTGVRTNVSLMAVIKQFSTAQDLLSRTKQPISGLQIKEQLTQYGIKPHQSTISAWFRDLGGYRRRQLYNPQDLVMLFTKAFIYKLNTQQIEGEN